MGSRPYYSARIDNRTGPLYNLGILKELFEVVYTDLHKRQYLDEALGYYCPGVAESPGVSDIDMAILRLTGKRRLWPVEDRIFHYSEADLFDIIEFLFDHVSEPVSKSLFHHDEPYCSGHYKSFDRAVAQEWFRSQVSPLLAKYDVGYQLSVVGQIGELAEPGLSTLLDAMPPPYDAKNVDDRILEAVSQFRKYHASTADRKAAVVQLASVLEFLRPQLKKVLHHKDEADLFQIANNFGIRHHTNEQKTKYDKDIWFRWIFYHYLATVHTALRLIRKAAENTPSQTE